MKRVLALIPARGGSKAIPGKNLVRLGGKPLIAHTIAAALKSKGVDRVLVTTDSAKIAATARRYGAEAPFLRPAKLSGDSVPMLKVLAHALEWLEEHEGWSPDIVALLQPTSPLRGAAHIARAVELVKRGKADTVVGVCRPDVHPWKCVRFKAGKMSYAVPRPNRPLNRQEFPEVYGVNGALYVTRAENIARGGLYGKRVLPLEMSIGESVDIDTPDDLLLAEFYLKRLRA